MGTVLEVRDIIRNYSKKGDGARPSEDDIKVIRGLSLKVEKKDFLGIMGKSGCGKSTLLRVLGLLDRPTEGKVFLRISIQRSFGRMSWLISVDERLDSYFRIIISWTV